MKPLRKNKGEWGYINDRRLRVTLITLFMYACAIGIFLLGIGITHTRKNLFTVISVLSILPASKSLVNMIMFFRFSSLSREKYTLFSSAAGDIPIIYELPLTTYERTFFAEAVACTGGSIICFFKPVADKHAGPDALKTKLKEHLDTVLKNDGHKGLIIKIYDDPESFTGRLREMNANRAGMDPVRDMSVLNTLKAVSL
ncbi:MAG: hypothetical protein K6E63_07920 [Lachnospiraceae bacterium]|nr:hypothetical protein [Lachnospiraceae bacterium]